MTKTALLNHEEFWQLVKTRHPMENGSGTGTDPLHWGKLKSIYQSCAHSLVMGKSPDSIHPLDDTNQAQGVQSQAALSRCCASLKGHKGVRRTCGNKRKSRRCHILSPCNSWAHCPPRRKCQAQRVQHCSKSARLDTSWMAIRRGLGKESGIFRGTQCSLGLKAREVAPLVSTWISLESINLGGKIIIKKKDVETW